MVGQVACRVYHVCYSLYNSSLGYKTIGDAVANIISLVVSLVIYVCNKGWGRCSCEDEVV